MPPIKIVVDSTADLPAEVTAALDITVIPCLLRFGNQTFREGVDISRAEFWARLRSDPRFPSTASPAPGVFEAAYRRLAPETASVVSIHLSARHSAIFNAARLGAEAAADCVHVVPVDSGQISLGMGLIAIAAAEAARKGASVTEILHIIDDLKRRTHLLAIVNTLDHLRRSGRANQIVARLGDLLRIKPILHVYAGEVMLQERVRSWARAQERLIQIVRSMAPLERAVLAHIQHFEAAEALRRALAGLLPAGTFTCEVGVTIGIHVGVGVAGIAFVCAQGDSRP